MAAFEVFQYQDSSSNTIRYLFNPSKRQSEDYGPVVLDLVIETFDPELDGTPSAATEPKPGTEFFCYMARDGAEVRYQFDPTARNGKSYVTAIHRPPENWQTLREEDLAVDDEEKLRRRFDEHVNEKIGLRKRDSFLDESEFDAERMNVDTE